ncbi:hypothetical protein K2173_020829 [Erythroxylum novogranatense]|uniref:Major facilitator superfamily (MFS) profile domain-containing protein n=1 Tax=Erythroxylum novogranatense TaxID=1862640 RepID=A0AAV8TP11_9ROSI|nr:hypothetical protein K2173_020829 [Erythroxylum novogranatense]
MDAEALVYTLDEGLSAVGFGKFQLMLLLYAGFGWVSEAMEIMILSFVGPAVKSQWGLSSAQETLLTTVVFAGELIGAYCWGLISDNYGRRKSFLCITMITSGVGLLSAFSPAYSYLLILRFVAGIGLGGGHVFLSWFLEFIPASHRGKWMVIFATFWTVGTVFEALLAWLVMPRLNWRWLLGLSAIPSFVLLLLYGLAPESPRYLYMRGKKTEAHQILVKMASLNQTELPPGIFVSSKAEKVDGESLPSERTPLLSATRKKNSGIKSGFSSFFMLFSSKLISTTLLLWILFFGHNFSYFGIVLVTSELSASQSECGSTILHSQYLQSYSLYIKVFLTSIAEVPGLLLSALIVDKLGRKLSMGIMLSLSALFLLPLVLGQSGIMTTALLFGARMCSIGSFTVACIYAPELYPTSVRTTGSGVANAMGRIGGMLCPVVAVGLVTGCHLKEAIFLFEVVIAVTAICILLFKVETKGRELSETLAESDPKADVWGGL